FGPGYDHKLFIFKQGLFTDDLFEEEKIDNDDYGVVEISKAEISYIYSLFLDGLFKLLDTIFQPLDSMDENIYTNIWLDYGKLERTQEADKDDFDGLHYDITGNEDDYPFLKDVQLFDYTFTDGMISHLTEDEYMDGDLEIDAGMLSEPDQSLIQLLETQWGIA